MTINTIMTPLMSHALAELQCAQQAARLDPGPATVLRLGQAIGQAKSALYSTLLPMPKADLAQAWPQ